MSDKFYGKNSRMCLGSVYTKKAQNKNRKGWRLSFPAYFVKITFLRTFLIIYFI